MRDLHDALSQARRVGLVLGAGGVPGHAFHAGALAAIAQQTGWDPRDADVIVGTSAGSQVAALLRAGISAQDLCAYVQQRDPSPAGAALFDRAGVPPDIPQTAISSLIGRPRLPGARLLLRAVQRPSLYTATCLATAVLPKGRINTDEHVAWLRRLTGDDWPEAPLWICAVRTRDARRVVLGRDTSSATVPEAVGASCAIPGWFRPVRIDGADHVDGGLCSPTNADVLRDAGCDLVVVSSPMSAADATGGRTALDRIPRALSGRLLQRETARLRERGARVLTVEPNREARAVMGTSVLDDRHVTAIVSSARRAATRQLGGRAAA